MKPLNKILTVSAAFVLSYMPILANTFPSESSPWERTSIRTAPISGLAATFAAYDNFLGDIECSHGTWFALEAGYDGLFSLSSLTVKENFEVAVFRSETMDFQQELKTGNAFLLGYTSVKQGKACKLDQNTNEDEFESSLFQLLKGQYVLVFIGAVHEASTDFSPELKASKTLQARKLVAPFEYRFKPNEAFVRFVVRDAKTGLPVKSKINVTGLKKLDNVYNASELTFDLINGKKAQISFDASGYFSKELLGFEVVMGRNNIITVLLYPFDLSKNMKLNGVQFEEGTHRFLASAYVDLDKLVSLLEANSSMEIEVEGHVNAVGSNSKGAQKLSELRAKAVRDYLVEKGIETNRIQFVGYGNSNMIYSNPQTPEQEQANRRVEIKFLD